MKKRFENWLIKKLLDDSSLGKEDINTDKRTVHLGLYGMAKDWFEPKHNLVLAMLIKWHGYTCTQKKFIIRTSDKSYIV